MLSLPQVQKLLVDFRAKVEADREKTPDKWLNTIAQEYSDIDAKTAKFGMFLLPSVVFMFICQNGVIAVLEELERRLTRQKNEYKPTAATDPEATDPEPRKNNPLLRTGRLHVDLFSVSAIVWDYQINKYKVCLCGGQCVFVNEDRGLELLEDWKELETELEKQHVESLAIA